MLKFYYSLAPNPMKVALMLEETGTPYEAIPVDTRRGEQHAPTFTAINPNAKVPAIVDGETTVFDSNAIVLYLAEKTKQFLPSPAHTGEALSWLMFVASGVGPFAGQAVHFKHYAPEKIPYAIERYQFEAVRHFAILDQRLASQEFMVADGYSYVDMALWGWLRAATFALGEEAWGKFKNVQRLKATIDARPAVAKVEALRQRHAFKAEMDDEARKAMFRHIKPGA